MNNQLKIPGMDRVMETNAAVSVLSSRNNPNPGFSKMDKKYCRACGEELKRKELNTGNMETPKQFSKRDYCNRSCKQDAMKIKYRVGQILGNNGIIFLHETDPYIWRQNKVRRAEFKCICGKIFVSYINKIKMNRVKSCGCLPAERGRKMCYKHGLAYDELWKKWCIIKQRLFNPNNIGYKYYGGRGIGMYEPWINNAKLFIEYCKTLDGHDNKELTIDRINNNGNYEPGNIRFTTHSIQTRNRRMKKNISGFIGVNPIKNGRWKASISCDYKEKVIYRGESKIIAAIQRDEYIIDNNLQGYILNFLSRK